MKQAKLKQRFGNARACSSFSRNRGRARRMRRHSKRCTMRSMKLGIALLISGIAAAQQGVPLQPLAQQVRQLEDALNYLGQPLTADEHKRINEAIANADQAAAVV